MGGTRREGLQPPPNLLLAYQNHTQSKQTMACGHLAGSAKLQRSKWHPQRLEPLGAPDCVARVGSMLPRCRLRPGRAPDRQMPGVGAWEPVPVCGG